MEETVMDLPHKTRIDLNFRGLFLLCFGENNSRCEAGVVNVQDHCLKITVKRLTLIEKVTHAVLPAELLTEDIHFEILNRPERVEIFKGSENFPRRSEEDFRWIVDLEGDEFHGRKLQIKQDAAIQRVVVHHGQFYARENHKVEIKPPESLAFSASITQKVGCRLKVSQGEKAVLRFDKKRQLEFPQLDNTSYEIDIENLCMPAEGPSISSEAGDFRHLYDVLMVDDSQQFDILLANTEENPLAPCDMAWLSKHTSLCDITP
jgi:hypothetical protein